MFLIRFVCIITSLIFISAKAQVNLQWQARYHFINDDGGGAVTVDDSGHVYITGYSLKDDINSDYDYVTIKYTSSGDSIWINRWDWNKGYDGGNDLLVDSIGNTYVAGVPVILKYNSIGKLLWESEPIAEFIRIEMDTEGFIYAGGTRLSNYMTVKFSPNGEEVWRRAYNGFGNEQDDFRDMVLDSNDNIIVTGESWGGSVTNYDFATIKYSSDGDTLWIRRYNGPAQNPPLDGAFGIAVDDSDNIYVTGWSQGPAERANTLTLKYNPEGDLIWERRFPEDGQMSNSGYDIVVDKDGSIYVASRAFGFSDFLNKYDTDGNHVWTVAGSQPNLLDIYFPKLGLDNFGNIYMKTTQGGGEYIVIKYDSSGKQIWKFDGIAGNATSLFIDISSNIYITGESLGNGFDILTIKLSQGTVGISQDGDILPSKFHLLPAYPNPFNTSTNISFIVPYSSDVDIKIYNILGEEITTLISGNYSAGTYAVQWDAGDLPSGMYLCRLQAGEEQKIIKLLLMK